MGRERWMLGIALLSLLTWSSSSVAQPPPPPPPPGSPDYVIILNEAYNDRNIEAFGGLFQQSVKVYLEGKLIASNRDQYLALIQEEFEGNLHLRTLSWAQGSQLLVMEGVTGCIPLHPHPGTVYHGCYKARSIRYDLADSGKIEAVHILEAAQAWNMHVGS